jgi:outer membrane protein TolC
MLSALTALFLANAPMRLAEVEKESWNNVAALQSELDWLRSKAQVTNARGALLPQVTLNSSGTYTDLGPQQTVAFVPSGISNGVVAGIKQTVTSPSNTYQTYDLNVALTQLLYDGTRWAQLSMNISSAQAAQGQLAEQRMASELEGIRRFYQVYRAQRSLDVLSQRVVSSQSQLDRARALFDAGKRHKEDAIAAEINLGNDRITVAQERSTLASAQADLAAWIARPGEVTIDVEDPGTLDVEPASLGAVDEVVRIARQERPLLKALTAQIRAAEAGVRAAWANYLPKLSGNVTYDRNAPSPGPFFFPLSNQNAFIGSVNLTWSLFSGLSTMAQVDDARYQRTKAELALEQSDREMTAELARATQTLDALIEMAKLAAANRDAARHGLQLVQERFSVGAASTLEVRDAQQKLTDSELVALNSRIDVEVARAQLLRDMGTLRPGGRP